MHNELSQADFETHLPRGVDVRSVVEQQVRKYLATADYAGSIDTDTAKAETFLRSVENAGYAKKQRKRGKEPSENSAPYAQMLKNWGRKFKDTKEPSPDGSIPFALGVVYYFFRRVANPIYFTEIIKTIWQPHQLIFQRFYYAKMGDGTKSQDFSAVCHRFHRPPPTVRREFDKIWVGDPVGSPPRIHLGPVEVVFGYEDDLETLSLGDQAKPEFVVDGMPAVFTALDWRSRLSGLHGRKREFDELVAWANDEENSLKVMLVSGPGGSGKTRLVADVVAMLVADEGWCGGFLGDEGRPIDGDGSGVALIIDYPEERTRTVADILIPAIRKIQANDELERPVRLFLVSRETKDAWRQILNHQIEMVNELCLDTNLYLGQEDALALAEDVSVTYSEILDQEPCHLFGVEAWYSRRREHGLPLHILAASIHAVINPKDAFQLDDPDVLIALADREIIRVRFYSTRDLGEKFALEKLLGLSVLTTRGLTKETVHELGFSDIWSGDSGNALLEAVRRTPFWQPKTQKRPSMLVKPEPDKLAAAFCLKALLFDGPSPALPAWLRPTAIQDGGNFGWRIARVSYDIANVDPSASRELETLSASMLDLMPDMEIYFKRVAYQHLSMFSANFADKICQHLLSIVSDDGERASILNNHSTTLAKLGRTDEALAAIGEAVEILTMLVDLAPDDVLPLLATALNNQAIMFSSIGQHKEAITAIEYALDILGELDESFPEEFLASQARASNTLSNAMSTCGRHSEALSAAQNAISYWRKLTDTQYRTFQSELGGALNTYATTLAVEGKSDAALLAIDEAVEIFRDLAGMQPDLYLSDFARALDNSANRLSETGRSKDALTAIEEAVNIYRNMAEARPETFSVNLAYSLYNNSVILSDLGRSTDALAVVEQSIAKFTPIFLKQPQYYESMIKYVIQTYYKCCDLTASEPHRELIQPILDTLPKGMST